MVCPLLALTILGCASHVRKDTDFLIEPADAAKLGYRAIWPSSLNVTSRERIGVLTAADTSIFVAVAPANLVTAVSVADGSVQWRQLIGEPTDRIMAILPYQNQKQVLVCTETRIFKLDRARGTILSHLDLDETVRTAPVLVNDLVVYGSANARIVAHDLITATMNWAYQMQGEILVPPQVTANSVFAADSRGNLALLTLSTGDLTWRNVTFGAIKAPSLITAARVYVPCTDMSLYALDRVTGKDRWVFHAAEALPYAPVAAGNTLVQPMPSGQLVGIDAAKGTELWRVRSAPLAILPLGQSMLLSFRDHLELVDPQTGRTTVTVPLHGWLQEVLPLPNNSLLLVARDGWMMKLDPK